MAPTDPLVLVNSGEQRSYGHISSLSSPLLEKLRDAVQLVCPKPKDGCTLQYPPGSIPLEGDGQPERPERGFVHWDPSTRVLVLSFTVPCPKDLGEFLQRSACSAPWLDNVAPQARVHSEALSIFQSIHGAAGQDLATLVQEVTGGVSPRRIKSVGWCVSGMVATIGALWAAVHYPTADVRCITFGAQKVGNLAFVQTYRWLVGLSYRVVYNRDPIPGNKGKVKLFAHELVHVHGEIYLDAHQARPQAQPVDQPRDYEDHSWQRYKDALDARFVEEHTSNAEFVAGIKLQAAADSSQGDDDKQRASPAPEAAALGAHASATAAGAQQGQGDQMVANAAEALQKGDADITDAGEVQEPTSINEPPQETSTSTGADRAQQSSLPQDGSSEPPAPDEPHADNAGTGTRDSSRQDTRSLSQVANHADGNEGAMALMTGEAAGGDQTADAPSKLGQLLMTGKISQAAVLAAAAYRDEETFRRVTGITSSKLVIDKDERNTHVHIGWLEDGTAVFAFRGTATMQDGMADIKVMRLDVSYLRELYPEARAHLGFLQQFVGVCQPHRPSSDLAAVLLQLSGGRAPSRVLCTGHSLGGALATLGAAWAALQWSQADVRCITFGSPRVGNRSFKRAFHSLVGTSLRLVYGRDPVPVLPPSVVYHHVQGAIHITPGGLIKLRSRPWHCKLMPNVSHHLMASYRSGIPGLGGLGQLGAAAHDWLEDEGPGSNGELPMRDTKAVPGIFFWRCVSARGD